MDCVGRNAVGLYSQTVENPLSDSKYVKFRKELDDWSRSARNRGEDVHSSNLKPNIMKAWFEQATELIIADSDVTEFPPLPPSVTTVRLVRCPNIKLPTNLPEGVSIETDNEHLRAELAALQASLSVNDAPKLECEVVNGETQFEGISSLSIYSSNITRTLENPLSDSKYVKFRNELDDWSRSARNRGEDVHSNNLKPNIMKAWFEQATELIIADSDVTEFPPIPPSVTTVRLVRCPNIKLPTNLPEGVSIETDNEHLRAELIARQELTLVNDVI